MAASTPSTPALLASGLVYAIGSIGVGWLVGICSGGELFQLIAEPFGINTRENGPAVMALFTSVLTLVGFAMGVGVAYAKSKSSNSH